MDTKQLQRIRAALEAAPGKDMRIVYRHGDYHVLDSKAPIPPRSEEDAEEEARILGRLDSQLRSTMGLMAILSERLVAISDRLESSVAMVEQSAANQAKFAVQIEHLTAEFVKVMSMPIEAVFDAKGILVGAKRVEKLAGSKGA